MVRRETEMILKAIIKNKKNLRRSNEPIGSSSVLKKKNTRGQEGALSVISNKEWKKDF